MLCRSPTFICLNILKYIMLLYILLWHVKVDINIYLYSNFRIMTVIMLQNAHILLQNSRGKYEFRYVFVQLDGPYPRTFIIEDNR